MGCSCYGWGYYPCKGYQWKLGKTDREQEAGYGF
jgi:hypothetical protein